MKTVDKSKPILVTGGGGYISSWIIKYLLEEGFIVHTTIRDLNKKHKYSHLENFSSSREHLIFYEADLLKPNSFLDAMKNCEIVIHTASPFYVTRINDPMKELIEPAKDGTINVLNSVNQTPSVKRVILTSSCASIYGDNIDINLTKNGIFTEEYWNNTSSQEHNPYSYSKTVAEEVAWKIAKEQNNWDLITINPAFVMGPSLSKRTDSTSVQTMQQICNGTFLFGAPELWFGIADVRDVAKAHILAAFKETARGRHIICTDSLPMLKMGEIIKVKYPNKFLIPQSTIPYFLIWIFGPILGFSHKYIEKNIGIKIAFDNSYTKKDLGLSFTKVEDTLWDHVEQLLKDSLI